MQQKHHYLATIRLEGTARGTPEQIRQYLDIKLKKLISEMRIPEPTDELKMHVENGGSTVYRKIVGDEYVM